MSRDFGVNQALVEDIFLKWLANPKNVDASWQEFFASLPPQDWPDLTSHGQIPAPLIEPPKRRSESSGGTSSGGTGDVDAPYRHPRSSGDYLPSLPPTAELVPFIADSTRQRATTSFPPTHDVLAANELQGRVSALVNAYRVRGHLFADLDPLRLQSQLPNEFLLEHYGLADVDLSTIFSTGDMAGPATMTLGEIVQKLNETYTRSIGVEFTFLEDRQARRWLQESMESTNNRVPLSREEQLRILRKLTDAEIFEQFLHTKFKGAKRFSLEGGESVISMLDYLVERSAACGVQEIVIGMAHRGRLNVLANILEMNVRDIFAGFEDGSPENHLGGGDVKYHLGWSTDRVTRSGDKVHLTLAFNPSHLEFVNPVVEGRVRAKQDRFGDETRSRVLPLIIHGDAAIAGQGVVAETLNLSELTAYATGGTIHLVINNQIGFTTIPNDSRSSRYCTDITRMLRCPVFHVNGEDPEAVTQVIRLATEFRQRYHRDVVIDLYCYRKYGHNEGDEPRFTQPLMYAAVDEKRTVREVYVDYLDETQSVPRSEAAALSEKRRQDLETALQETRRGDYDLVPDSMRGVWSGYHGGLESKSPNVSTGVAKYTLRALIEKLTTVPSDFTPHRT
ncbi:MAG: thiamine pyrophosphate-dependent enzyme, partial [Myxococcota bacterium]